MDNVNFKASEEVNASRGQEIYSEVVSGGEHIGV